MENRRQLLQDVFDGKPVDRVPCGFWHHFVVGPDQFAGLERPEILERAVEGHRRYFEQVQPDMMKIMSEGFFGYPPIMDNAFETEADLRSIRAVGAEHPWITEQVKHVKRIADLFRDKVMCFYNIFSPLQMIRIRFDFLDEQFDRFVELAEAYPEAFHQAGQEMMKDVMTLTEKLFSEAKIDGIYFCVQNIQSEKYDLELYKRIVEPCEKPVLDLANTLGDNNILHICGYAHHTNKFDYYKNYVAKVYNWATYTENISMAEGKAYYNGASVLGGFDNNAGTLIDTGSAEALNAYTKQLIIDNGFTGYIIGADCSIPNDIDDNQVRIIRDACHYWTKERLNEEGLLS